MTRDDLRDLCLSMPSAEETFPFGEDTSVFKVAGKIFALGDLDADPLSVSVKIDPEESIALQAEYAQVTPGYHLNKKHWVSVVIEHPVTEELIEQLLRGSHELVRPRSMRL